MFNTPILFLIFNRPTLTKKVFSAIKSIQPKHLYIAADGPRNFISGERERCALTKEVVSEIDWPCDVKTLFREKNIGCKLAVSGAINWFFQHFEEGIILEDDCFPNPSFFTFCEFLLNEYRDNNRIMHISGDNFQNGIQRSDGCYYFTNINHNWGWATWRRAWKYYDIDIKKWDHFYNNGGMKTIFNNTEVALFFKKQIDNLNNIDTWDWQWMVSIWINDGISINPNVNLVSNIGFGEHSTHTKDKKSKSSNLETFPLAEIVKPSGTSINYDADTYFYYKYVHVSKWGLFKYAVKKFIFSLIMNKP